VTLSEEYEALRKLLRLVARGYPPPMPAPLQAWWDIEQPIIATEKAESDQRKANRAAEIIAKIAELQSQLAKLQ
tara:strand:- start:294 stop:515 length:222 start_codon:yes stop_codon:yes gene_type:complete